jgi:hypothetical protein
MWCGRPDAGVADALVEPEHVPVERDWNSAPLPVWIVAICNGSRELT